MNSIKVTTVLPHTDPITKTEIWGCEGKLILIPYNDGSEFNKGSIPLTQCVSFDLDNGNSHIMPQKWYYPIIISETEQIFENTKTFNEGINGDWFYNTLYKKIFRTGDITKYDFKILALPESFSKSTLKDIAHGKIKDGDKVFIECEERRANNGTFNNPPNFYYQIKLNSEGHITLIGFEQKFSSLEEDWNNFYRQYYTETGKRADTANGVINFVEWMKDNCYPPVKKMNY